MKRSHFTIAAVAALFLFQMACAPAEKETEVNLSDDALVGSWRLINTIEIGHEDTTNRRDGEEKFYVKYINDTHFTWVEYDRKSNLLLGTGGGTYSLKDNIYTEYIDFYFPPGANELGQAIPFTAEIDENGIWRHTGYAKLMEFDPESGDIVMADSAIIDEEWERIAIEPSDDSGGKLIGTWNIVNYRESTDSTWNEYPDFYEIFKLLTPTHFLWVHFNSDDDEIYALGGGTYTISGDKYMEKIQYVYPDRPNLLNAEASFTWRQDNPNHWFFSGDIRGGQEDTYLEENWQKFVPEPEAAEVVSSN